MESAKSENELQTPKFSCPEGSAPSSSTQKNDEESSSTMTTTKATTEVTTLTEIFRNQLQRVPCGHHFHTSQTSRLCRQKIGGWYAKRFGRSSL
uniref:Uncharacterized protein n=1 Tax=Kalanchoe fedtschenkoi TaxID=63787 RepID=A0A7N0VBF2_KALFE